MNQASLLNRYKPQKGKGITESVIHLKLFNIYTFGIRHFKPIFKLQIHKEFKSIILNFIKFHSIVFHYFLCYIIQKVSQSLCKKRKKLFAVLCMRSFCKKKINKLEKINFYRFSCVTHSYMYIKNIKKYYI